MKFVEPLLTHQQKQIFEQIIHESCSPKQAARALNLSVYAVNSQLGLVYRKLSVTDRTQACLALIRKGEIALFKHAEFRAG